MLLLVIFVGLLVVGIIGYKVIDDHFRNEALQICFACLIVVGAIALIVGGVFLITVPFEAKNTVAKYDALQQTLATARQNEGFSIERAGAFDSIAEMNQKVNVARTFVDSKLIGAFYSRYVAELEFIE